MAMANMNLIGVFTTKLWPVQALTCSGGDGGGGETKNVIPPKFHDQLDKGHKACGISFYHLTLINMKC